MNNILTAICLDGAVAERVFPPAQSPDSAASYLTDESRLCGRAERLFFPRTESDLIVILRATGQAKVPVTLSGARTGITGGAVPLAGWSVSIKWIASWAFAMMPGRTGFISGASRG
ncbi:MAG: hypothetical protein KKD14_01945 [Verrucomicrobia bacterium]|nr:hypothetical protein [Verrucomicrobiota bacterium]MBU4289997.1 hypothetical protein [Verrucomicrobiota bacterium]